MSEAKPWSSVEEYDNAAHGGEVYEGDRGRATVEALVAERAKVAALVEALEDSNGVLSIVSGDAKKMALAQITVNLDVLAKAGAP